MLLFANKARAALTGSVASAAGQVAAVTTGAGALFVGVGGVATSTTNPMRCVLTAVDANGNDTGAFEVVEVVRSGDNLTLQSRGLEGTTAAAWGAGTVIECRPTAELMSRGREIVLYQGVGQLNVATNAVATSLLPGGTPLSIPIGLLDVGDFLRILAEFGHDGGTSQAQYYEVLTGGQSNLGFVGDAAASTAYATTLEIGIASPTLQAVKRLTVRGDSNGGSQARRLTVNLGTTAFDIDIQARFGATTSETLSLLFYRVSLTKAFS
jgi:hypothetical protein